MSQRRYYSSRSGKRTLRLSELSGKVQQLFLYFKERDYFKEQLGIQQRIDSIPEVTIHKAGFTLGFQPFPISEWENEEINEDNIFDFIEFLYDHVSMPGEWGLVGDSTGYNYDDYVNYDRDAGIEEFCEKVNSVLADYKEGYELTESGEILALAHDGLEQIIDAEIPGYDKENVDDKVRLAVKKWRNRRLDINERRQAIHELADVFEWLKKTGKLEGVLSNKDEAALFNIANNFAVRHHEPNQKSGYDKDIWYAWMFHFYLATYHAAIRLIIKNETK